MDGVDDNIIAAIEQSSSTWRRIHFDDAAADRAEQLDISHVVCQRNSPRVQG